MSAVIEEVSTITAKGQTTVPKAVRQALGVDCGGRIAFRIDHRGVTVYRADDEENDPVLDQFLAFLARDVQSRPDAVQALTPALAERIAELINGVELDLDAPVKGDVNL